MGFALTGPSNALGGYVSDRLRNPPLVIGASLGVLACTSALLVVVDSIPLLVLVVALNAVFRSEEHTSELQSHSDLVCRLLLEKKKNTSSSRTRVRGSSHADH